MEFFQYSGSEFVWTSSFESCFDTPFTVIFMLGMVGIRARVEGSVQQGVSVLMGQVL